MFYKRNVPNWERALRLVAGMGMVAGGLLVLKATPLGVALAVLGGVALATGSVGFCPMCAMVGRRPVGDGQEGGGR
jgi:hypothetical protein